MLEINLTHMQHHLRWWHVPVIWHVRWISTQSWLCFQQAYRALIMSLTSMTSTVNFLHQQYHWKSCNPFGRSKFNPCWVSQLTGSPGCNYVFNEHEYKCYFGPYGIQSDKRHQWTQVPAGGNSELGGISVLNVAFRYGFKNSHSLSHMRSYSIYCLMMNYSTDNVAVDEHIIWNSNRLSLTTGTVDFQLPNQRIW